MSSSSTEVTLSKVLHEVPRLWDLLDPWSKKRLSVTSLELHKQTFELVSSIKPVHRRRIPHPRLEHTDISWYVSCNWTYMRSLDLTLDPALVPELSNGAWPLLVSLSLNRPSTSPSELPAEPDEHIFDSFKGKWPLLERLVITLGKLKTGHITALVETEWISLKTLKLEPLDRSLPDLMRGNWPQLKDLSLGDGLSEGLLEPLSACPWSTLERLELVRCRIEARAMACLVQADLPQLKELSFVQVLLTLCRAYPERETKACFAHLACGRWPLLAVLKLEILDERSKGLLCDELSWDITWGRMHFLYNHAFDLREPDDILALTLGKWPCLQSLTFDNFYVWARDVGVLVQAAWPDLTSLTMIGCFSGPESITLCMQKWPHLKSLTLGSSEDRLPQLTEFVQTWHPNLNRFHVFVHQLHRACMGRQQLW